MRLLSIAALALAGATVLAAAVPTSIGRGADIPEDAPSPPQSGRDNSSAAAQGERLSPRQSATTPLVIDGMMYAGSAYNRIVALDADTGKEIWVKDLADRPSIRGISYWPGMPGFPPELVLGRLMDPRC